MQMVRHDNEFIQFDIGIPFGQPYPGFYNQPAEIIKKQFSNPLKNIPCQLIPISLTRDK